jgi:hypothetical protein
MTETGYRYGVCALRAKRAEIAGDIDQIKIKLRQRQRDLARVDDILRLLAPDSDPTQIPAKRPTKYLNIFRQGELSRLVLGVLRASGKPLSNREITTTIMAGGGIGQDAWTPMRRRVRANLAYLHGEGRVGKTGYGICATWTIFSGLPHRDG